MAFITGVPARLRVRQAALATVEINFLCVHKKLRQKRLAPVLIKVGPHGAATGSCVHPTLRGCMFMLSALSGR